MNSSLIQDTSVLFGQMNGEMTSSIASMLKHMVKPVVENLGVPGKVQRLTDRPFSDSIESNPLLGDRLPLTMCTSSSHRWIDWRGS